MQTVLVTGGAGFIGSALVGRLLAEGNDVRILDDLSQGSSRRLDAWRDQIEFQRGDIRDADAVRRACIGVDIVMHLAYINGTALFYEKPEMVLDVAIRGMLNVLDGCRANGVHELILMSSSEVYQTPERIPTAENAPLIVPDPLNPRYSYGGGKIACELMAINYGRNNFDRVVIVRPHNVYGRDMGFWHAIPEITLRMRQLPSGPEPHLFRIQGTGREIRSFVHIDDFIEGFITCAKKGGHLDIYHVGNPEEVQISDLAKKIAVVLGRTVEIEPAALAQGSTPRRCPDISKAMALGYEPRVPLATGLPDVVHWYDTHAHLATLTGENEA